MAALAAVVGDDGSQVCVKVGVSIHHQEWHLGINMAGSASQRSAGAHRRFLYRIFYPESPSRAIAKVLDDPGRHVPYAEHKMPEAMTRKEMQLVFEKRSPMNGRHWLGDVIDEWPEPFSQAACQKEHFG